MALGRKDAVVDQTNWRQQIREPHKQNFDDAKKARWIAAYSRTNNITHSNKICGIHHATYQWHRRNDPEFRQAIISATQDHRDTVAEEVLRRGRDGWLEPVYSSGKRAMTPLIDDVTMLPKFDHNGNVLMVPASIRKYDSQLLQLEAKRVDHSYRERGSETSDDDTGGVLVAPSTKTPEQYIKEQMAKADKTQSPGDAIDV